MSAETKKCKKCGEDIPVKYAVCNHCNENQYKWQSRIGLGIFALFFIWILSLGLGSSTPQTTQQTRIETPVEQPTRVNTTKNGTYVVSSPEFEFMGSKRVNLWQSYTDRTLTGVVNQGDIIEISNYDVANNYCYVTLNARRGWASCDWFVAQ